MEEIYILKRTDTNQYYQGLLSNGTMLWVDTPLDAYCSTEEELKELIDRMNGIKNPKYEQLVLELL